MLNDLLRKQTAACNVFFDILCLSPSSIMLEKILCGICLNFKLDTTEFKSAFKKDKVVHGVICFFLRWPLPHTCNAIYYFAKFIRCPFRLFGPFRPLGPFGPSHQASAIVRLFARLVGNSNRVCAPLFSRRNRCTVLRSGFLKKTKPKIQNT